MAIQSTTKISIGSTVISSYKKLSITQGLAQHNTFELICRVDVLENISGEMTSETRNFLGETFLVEITSLGEYSGYKEFQFKGVVTEVNNSKGFQSHQEGDICIVKGYSASVLSDDGPHYCSFTDKGLLDILNDTFQSYDRAKLEMAFTPDYTKTLHYSVRSAESSFEYAKRLASQYGQWFYYDGKALIFGEPESQEPIEVKYGYDLLQFSLKLAPKSNTYTYFTNDYLTSSFYEVQTSAVDSESQGLNSFSSNKGSEMFSNNTQVYASSYTDNVLQQRLDFLVTKQKKATDAQQVMVIGMSDNPGVVLGSVIQVIGQDGEGYGSFKVIKVDHYTSEKGKYENHFEAITDEGAVAPNTNIEAFPKSATQVAIVKENSDPEGLGRIRVQFYWQEPLGEMTPWIRVLTPHSGAGKGFHFIPEIEEEVLIGFEQNSAERPFVMGSLYNGNANPKEWNTEQNDLKVIKTRSGHTMELNDAEGSETIKIHDKEGSIITFDTQAKSLFIQATENIEIAAKNIKMVADENIEIQAQGNIQTASEGNTEILSNGTASLQVQSDVTISSDASITVDAATDATVKGQNVTSEGQVGAELKGAQTKVQGQMTVVQGASGKIDVI